MPKKLSSDFEQFFLVKNNFYVFLGTNMTTKYEMLCKKYEILWTGSIIAPGVQIFNFEADQMSHFQDMKYYDSIVGIILNFFFV